MATFLSNSIHKVDRKGRVSVPSAFRHAASSDSFQGVALYPALGAPCIEGSDMAFFDDLSRRIHERHSVVSQKSARLARRLLGSVEPLTFDPEGRVVLPASLREYAGITDRVQFIGIGPKFQMWDPDRLVQYDLEDDMDLEDEAGLLGPLYGGSV